jgi:hypothetical protein
MRNLLELGMDEGQRPVTAGKLIKRQPPTREQIQRFESAFQIKLPQDYVSFLRFTNGGHPSCGSFTPPNMKQPAAWDVNLFFFLDDDTSAVTGLWCRTRAWQDCVTPNEIPIANDPCGDVIVLSYDEDVPSVKLYVHEGQYYLNVANSFSDFIDMLRCPEEEDGQ